MFKSINIAHAAEPFAGRPVIGTTGIGMQFSTPILPKYINLSFGYSYFSINFNSSTNHEPWHENCRISGAPVFLSAYFLGPRFHFDLGIFINQNHVNVTAIANPGVGVDGLSTTVNDHVRHFLRGGL